MSWTPLQSTKTQVADVTCAFTLHKKTQRGTLFISVPCTVAGVKGWDKFDYAHVDIGAEEHDGQLMIEPVATEAAFAIGRLKNTLVLRLPEQKGWSGRAIARMACEHEWVVEKNGLNRLLVKLPPLLWRAGAVATAAGVMKSVAAAVGDKRHTYEIPSLVGNVVSFKKKSARLIGVHAKIFKVMHDAFDQYVRKFQFDVELDLLEASIPKLHDLIAPLGLIIISQPDGGGWALKISPEHKGGTHG